MSKRLYFFALVSGVMLFASVTRAQYPIMDRVANKVVQKYQTSTCEQLWQESKPCSLCAAIQRCAPPLSTEWRDPSLTRCLNAV
jgi:hypothetical protein